MNILERANRVPESNLMQGSVGQTYENEIDVKDLPENIQTRHVAKDQTVEVLHTLEDGLEFDQQQVESLSDHSKLLEEHSKQLASMNQTLGSLYKMLYKEFNKIEPRIDDRNRIRDISGERVDNKPTAAENFGSLLDAFDFGDRRNRRRPGRNRGGRPGGGGGNARRPPSPRRIPRIGKVANAARTLGTRALPFLGPAGAVAGAGMLGWEIGTAINERIINPTVQWATGDANQSLGGLIYDKIHGDSSIQQTQPASPSTNQSQANTIARRAETQGIGSISAHFESGGRGVSTVSTGRGDHGGVSYGKHQLSSKTGTMAAFLNSEHGEPFRIQFRGLKPGTPAFNNRYKQVADSNGPAFEQAQQAFMVATHYNPLANFIKKELGMDVSNRSRAVQEIIYSVATQYGSGRLGKRFIKEAVGSNPESLSDEELIRKIQKHRHDSVLRYFSSSSHAVRRSIMQRAKDEQAVALSMLHGQSNDVQQAEADAAVANSPLMADTQTQTPTPMPQQAQGETPEIKTAQTQSQTPSTSQVPEPATESPAPKPEIAAVEPPRPADASSYESVHVSQSLMGAQKEIAATMAELGQRDYSNLPDPKVADIKTLSPQTPNSTQAPASTQAQPQVSEYKTVSAKETLMDVQRDIANTMTELGNRDYSHIPDPAVVVNPFGNKTSTVQNQTENNVSVAPNVTQISPVRTSSQANNLVHNTTAPMNQVQTNNLIQNSSQQNVGREYYNQAPTISTTPISQTGTMPIAEPIVRQEYSNVQKVMAVDQPIAQAPAPTQVIQQSSQKEEAQRLSEFPAFMDDHGLLFITSGYI